MCILNILTIFLCLSVVGNAAQQAAVSCLQSGHQQRESHPVVRQGELQPRGPQVLQQHLHPCVNVVR